jgi:hypothetical protein
MNFQRPQIPVFQQRERRFQAPRQQLSLNPPVSYFSDQKPTLKTNPELFLTKLVEKIQPVKKPRILRETETTNINIEKAREELSAQIKPKSYDGTASIEDPFASIGKAAKEVITTKSRGLFTLPLEEQFILEQQFPKQERPPSRPRTGAVNPRKVGGGAVAISGGEAAVAGPATLRTIQAMTEQQAIITFNKLTEEERDQIRTKLNINRVGSALKESIKQLVESGLTRQEAIAEVIKQNKAGSEKEKTQQALLKMNEETRASIGKGQKKSYAKKISKEIISKVVEKVLEDK